MDTHPVLSILQIFPQPVLLLTPAATTVLLVLFFAFLVMSFLVSGSEVAFFSLTQKEISNLRMRERPGFRRVANLLDKPKTLLASMLIANSFFNIGTILISNILISSWIPGDAWWHFAIKVLAITIILSLFAEVMPKVWATHHKVWFATNASLVIEIFNSLFYGISKRLISFNDSIENKFGFNKGVRINDNDIDEAIDLLPEDEASQEEKEILKGIRKFGETDVRKIMRTRMDVSGIPASAEFDEVKQLVRELHYSRLPVYRTNLDDIAGVLHTKDLLAHLHEGNDFEWKKLLRPAFFVHEKKYIEDLFQEFRTKRIHFAVVVDEFGGTSGIVTLEDIIEEVIGDIKDEFDDEESGNTKIDDFNYIFEGKMMIHDVCKAMGLPADTFDNIRGESDSLGGLVLELAGEFPEANEQFISGDFIFTPLEINRNRIDKVRITIQQNHAHA